MSFTIRSAQNLAVTLLKEVGITTSVLDAQLLLGAVTKRDRIMVQLLGSTVLSSEDSVEFFKALARRLTHEPIAYILGEKEFYGHRFLVTKDVLIPRPDTETVVEECLKLISDSPEVVFDICTGSGAIAIALLLNRPKLQVEACDISEKALHMARLNAESLGVLDRLTLHHGDLFKTFTKKAHLIVSNPPYISQIDCQKLEPTVREYEPMLALDGGEDGLDFYRAILREAPNYLADKGFLVMEIGFDQASKLKELVSEHWHYRFFKDLAGHDRGIVLQKR